MRSISIQEQKETQLLEHLVRRYPEKAMEHLAGMGKEQFLAMYTEVSGIELTTETLEFTHAVSIE